MISPTTAVPTDKAGVPQKLRAQATELEGVFLNTLVKEMFSTVHKDKEFGGGFAEDTWQGMQAEQYAGQLAANGGVGLADSLVRDLMAIQGAAAPTSVAPRGAYK